MDLQKTRIFLFVSLGLVALALFNFWQKEHPVVTTPQTVETTNHPSAADIPTEQAPAPIAHQPQINAQKVSETIDIETDVLRAKIDLNGGDIVRAELSQYPISQDNPAQGVVILDEHGQRQYIAQSGLIGKDERGPDSKQAGRAQYTTTQKHYATNGQEQLKVDLHWQNQHGLKVTKIFTFTKGSYLVDVAYEIHNQTDKPWVGNFYGQIKRNDVKESSGMFGVQMYQGGAVYTPAKKFKKLSFSDMKKAPFKEQIQGGWAAMLEHYFLCAWIPAANSINNYYTRVDNEDAYNVGAISAVEVGPNQVQTVSAQTYIGPEIADKLKAISPGLNLTIDYGILWPISQLLFWLLKTINQYVGNWGWSIIFVTMIVKLAFYKLSAASYRSMGKMRILQPKVELLRERYKDDKQQFSTHLMELYRKEKLNPLGGCLPIVIQIPVFIALYYVLLESVELRHAPFMFWIKDLSSKDPYYILPLIMGLTMFVQQKMNPPPPDPMQAKMMMFMPVLFTGLFLSFPSGLVLYWTANNILSMLQQWFITRSLEGTVAKKAK